MDFRCQVCSADTLEKGKRDLSQAVEESAYSQPLHYGEAVGSEFTSEPQGQSFPGKGHRQQEKRKKQQKQILQAVTEYVCGSRGIAHKAGGEDRKQDSHNGYWDHQNPVNQLTRCSVIGYRADGE